MQHTAVALGYIQNGVAAVKLLGLLIGLVILGIIVISLLLGLEVLVIPGFYFLVAYGNVLEHSLLEGLAYSALGAVFQYPLAVFLRSHAFAGIGLRLVRYVLGKALLNVYTAVRLGVAFRLLAVFLHYTVKVCRRLLLYLGKLFIAELIIAGLGRLISDYLIDDKSVYYAVLKLLCTFLVGGYIVAHHGVVLGIGVKELLVLSEGDLTVAYGGYGLVAVDNCSIAFTCGRSNAAPYYGKCQHQCQCSCKYLLHYVFFSNLWAS